MAIPPCSSTQDPALDPLHPQRPLPARRLPRGECGYRLQRGTSEQVDLGWQWPLDSLWGAADSVSGTSRAPSRRAGTAWAA